MIGLLALVLLYGIYAIVDGICSVAISADTEDEVIEAAARYAEEVQGYEDTPDLREQLKAASKEGSPCP